MDGWAVDEEGSTPPPLVLTGGREPPASPSTTLEEELRQRLLMADEATDWGAGSGAEDAGPFRSPSPTARGESPSQRSPRHAPGDPSAEEDVVAQFLSLDDDQMAAHLRMVRQRQMDVRMREEEVRELQAIYNRRIKKFRKMKRFPEPSYGNTMVEEDYDRMEEGTAVSGGGGRMTHVLYRYPADDTVVTTEEALDALDGVLGCAHGGGGVGQAFAQYVPLAGVGVATAFVPMRSPTPPGTAPAGLRSDDAALSAAEALPAPRSGSATVRSAPGPRPSPLSEHTAGVGEGTGGGHGRRRSRFVERMRRLGTPPTTTDPTPDPHADEHQAWQMPPDGSSGGEDEE